MKTSLMFRDQVNVLNNWFDAWNECEQIVALYSLFRKVTPGPTRFLIQVLGQNSEGCVDIQYKENQANNPAYIKNLCQESKEYAVQQLLCYLPLLRSGNNDAKCEYLKIIPKILTHSIENKCHIEESRQLLSYCLIHPAITPSERAQFTVWLGHLDERNACPQSGKSHVDKENVPNPVNDNGVNAVPSGPAHELNQWQNIASTQDSGIGLEQFPSTGPPNKLLSNMTYNQNTASDSTTHIQGLLQPSNPGSTFFTAKNGNPYSSHKKLTRSTTAPQPNNVSDWLNKHHEEMTKLSLQKSPPIPHAPLSPQSSSASSGSESHEENLSSRNTFLEDRSGMRDVPIWLKNLRLHKYSYLFQQLSYDEMLNLTEERLESQNVTKGARHKIVLSIKKLKERESQLKALEKDVMDSCNLKQALQQVKGILNTPIKAFEVNTTADGQEKSQTGQFEDTISDGDIPGQITRLMGKVCTQLLVNNRPEEDCFAMYLQVIDKCMMHEAWGIEPKKKLASWKQQIQKMWQPTGLRQKKGFTSPLALRNLLPCQRVIRGQIPKQVGPQTSWSFTNSPAAIIGSIPQTGSLPLYRNSSLNNFTSRPPLYELKPQIGRTYSVPITKSANSLPVADIGIMEPEIAARLDSLCLSMTEHALGNLDSPEKGSTL